jgi:hypothetical protein
LPGQQLSETVFVEDGHAEFDGFSYFDPGESPATT